MDVICDWFDISTRQNERELGSRPHFLEPAGVECM